MSITQKIKNTKVFKMIRKSQEMKDEMNELELKTPVKRYLELDKQRSSLHRDLRDHVQQYGVAVEEYKPAGLVERNSRWVTVKDIEAFAEDNPDMKDRIMGLINQSKSYYTRSVD